jgi:5-methylcytosine-specific restriction endonuclease McrA
MDFEYPEDKKYFDELFDEIGRLKGNRNLFDFRDQGLKRNEFNKIRNSILSDLIDKYGDTCQLKCHADCSGVATEVDHLIPLASNVLNKELRKLKGKKGKKTPSQSFGSNHLSNFALACKRCNAFKKHRLPNKEILRRVHNIRNGDF